MNRVAVKALNASSIRTIVLCLQWQNEIRAYEKELSLLGMPASYLEEPDEISSRMPSFGTAEQAEAFNSKFASKLAALELKADTLRNYVQPWSRLSLEQRNRRLILALAERR